MMRATILILASLMLPAFAASAERATVTMPASTASSASDEVLKHAMQDILRHYYSVKVTMQYCASRFDDMQPDLKASHSRWVERNSGIVSEARDIILEHHFSADSNALDKYLMAQIKPGLVEIQRNNSTEQKLHCFDTMVGIEEGAIDISNKFKKEYDLLRSL